MKSENHKRSLRPKITFQKKVKWVMGGREGDSERVNAPQPIPETAQK